MSQSLLLPALAGVAAGLAVALAFFLLYLRGQRRTAAGVLATAKTEADRLLADAAQRAEAARSDAVVAAKVETLKLREDLEREI